MKNEMTIEEISEVNAQLNYLVAILELRVAEGKSVPSIVAENDKKRLAKARAAKLVYFQKMILGDYQTHGSDRFDIQHAELC